ncbi:hypothetical protein GUI12_00440 [Anaplasmataceae bacterium AB001_6]|nr:hypothetical protein GUI12_00440 [Anaplasmataceae bacterium AB001_6]
MNFEIGSGILSDPKKDAKNEIIADIKSNLMCGLMERKIIIKMRNSGINKRAALFISKFFILSISKNTFIKSITIISKQKYYFL